MRSDLSPALQEPAKEAAKLNLYLTHYNSGTRHKKLNGTYIFASTEPRDYHTPGAIAHLVSLRAVRDWLAGYAAGQRAMS